MDHIRGMYKGSFAYTLTDNDLDRINRLAAEKYSTWEWNFGSSPHVKGQELCISPDS
jgi:lipoate-protein ligase A